MTQLRISLLATLAGVALIAAPLQAQTSFEVGPLFGYYLPTGSFESASVYSTALPRKPSDLAGFAWGGEARAWFGGRLGVAAQSFIASSDVGGGVTPAGVLGATSARVLTFTVQGLLDLSPASERYRLWLGAGPGLVRHEGDAYAPYGSPTDLAGTVGAGVNLPIFSDLSVTAGASALFYMLDVPMPLMLQENPGSLERGFQTDLLFRLGLSWAMP